MAGSCNPCGAGETAFLSLSLSLPVRAGSIKIEREEPE